MFGKNIPPKEEAKKSGGVNPRKCVRVDSDWPEDFKKNIYALAEKDPLSARLYWKHGFCSSSADPLTAENAFYRAIST